MRVPGSLGPPGLQPAAPAERERRGSGGGLDSRGGRSLEAPTRRWDFSQKLLHLVQPGPTRDTAAQVVLDFADFGELQFAIEQRVQGTFVKMRHASLVLRTVGLDQSPAGPGQRSSNRPFGQAQRCRDLLVVETLRLQQKRFPVPLAKVASAARTAALLSWRSKSTSGPSVADRRFGATPADVPAGPTFGHPPGPDSKRQQRATAWVVGGAATARAKVS